MNKIEGLQNKKDFIVKFFNENTHFIHYKVCKDLGISERAIYVLRKTKHQALNRAAIDKLIEFIQTQTNGNNKQ